MHAIYFALGAVATLSIGLQSAQAQAPTVTGTALMPRANAVAVPRTSPVTIPFSQPIVPATGSTIKLHTQFRGVCPATVSTNGNAVVITPAAAGQALAFKPGETVWVTVPASVRSTANVAAVPYVYQFTAAVRSSSATFTTSPNITADAYSTAVADLDGDGDLDFVTFGGQNSAKAFSNNGRGVFSGVGTLPLRGPVAGLVLGDIDGDGDPDALSVTGGYTSVCFNTGNGVFVAGPETVTPYSVGLALGDIDGDGDLDLLTAIYSTSEVTVRVNNGNGVFSTSGQVMSVAGNPRQPTLGDIDGDGDLDLLVACAGFTGAPGAISVRLNDGNGLFSGNQEIGGATNDCRLGDLDNDGDLDIFSNGSGGAVYKNNGQGIFTLHAQSGVPVLAAGAYHVGLALGDLDGDGDLDLLTNDYFGTTRIWLNLGVGMFSPGQNLTLSFGAYDSTLSDVDGDGDLDLLTASTNQLINVRLNGGTSLAALASGSGLRAEIFPNPVRQSDNVSLIVPANTFASVELRNVLGQVVQSLHYLPIENGLASSTLNVKGLAAGMYMIYIITDKGGSRQQLVLD